MENKIEYQKLKLWNEKEKNIVVIDKVRLVEIDGEFKRMPLGKGNFTYIERRSGGVFHGKALYLPSTYEWILGEDDEGVLCLVPLKTEVRVKEEE